MVPDGMSTTVVARAGTDGAPDRCQPGVGALDAPAGHWAPRTCPAHNAPVALAVCLLFDPETDRAIRRLWAALEAAGVGTLLSHTHRRHVPHLSYTVLRTFDVDAVAAAVRALPEGSALELHFDAVGLFPRGRGALLMPATEALLTRQRAVVDAVGATGADLHWHYRPGRWLPHCSLTTGTSQELLPTAAVRAFDVLPLEGRAERAALIDSGTGQHWPLTTLP